MTTRIHDDEFDTGEPVVRALLAEQLPELGGVGLSPVDGTGTSNALWCMHDADDAPIGIVRLPRTAGAVRSIKTEVELLPALAATDLGPRLEIPTLLHAGDPTAVFSQPWAVTSWLDGDDAWAARVRLAATGPVVAHDLAAVVEAIGALTDMPAPARSAGRRGGPLEPVLAVLDRWLTDPAWDAGSRLPVAEIGRLADAARELVDEPVDAVFLHGDLIPGNLLVDRTGRIHAVIDWGGAGYGDRADDLVPAWAVLDVDARQAFRDALDVDDATWIRARTFALEQAVGGVLYYVPRANSLGDVMQRTLDRLIDEM